MADPFRPGWRPASAGADRGLGDVGSGPGFGADLYELYRAGRVGLPRVAEVFAELTRQVHHTHGPGAALAGHDWHGQRAHLRWEHLRDRLQRALGVSSLILVEVGRRLVGTAERYVRADADAAAAMRRLLDAGSRLFRAPPVRVDPPPAPEDYRGAGQWRYGQRQRAA